jgi:hypothetical protein
MIADLGQPSETEKTAMLIALLYMRSGKPQVTPGTDNIPYRSVRTYIPLLQDKVRAKSDSERVCLLMSSK